MNYQYPGTFLSYPLVHEKYPDPEFDPQGVPYGIQPDPDNPYIDHRGNTRRVYVYRPASIKPMMNVHAMIVLTEDGHEAGLEKALIEGGFLDLAEKEGFFLFFAVAGEGGWEPGDTGYLSQLIHSVAISCVFSGRERCHDYRICLIAAGKGAEIAHATAALYPDHVNSLLSFGGNISRELLSYPDEDAAASVWMVNSTGDGYKFWLRANGLSDETPVCFGDSVSYVDKENRARQLRLITTPNQGIDSGIVLRFWRDVFSTNINPFSVKRGRVANIMDVIDNYRPSIHLNDRSLGSNSHAPHTWLEFSPGNVKADGTQYPMVLFLHGGACDAFIEAANTGLHCFGDKMGFFTVYATATNGFSWNSVFHPDRENDVEYIESLIKHMLDRYPIDPSRVYISGFSNGSGMAQVFSVCHPEMIAGVMAFNTRFRPDEKTYKAAALAKQRRDYRMPVFYSYGTRDAEYPILNGSAQFEQMRFWKAYNNIEQKELDEKHPSRVGCTPDKVTLWGKTPNGDFEYCTNEFNTQDEPNINLYNYTIVEKLPHAVEPRLIPAAWAFVSQFSRSREGELIFSKGMGDYELYEV